jgi:hypothetical protein
MVFDCYDVDGDGLDEDVIFWVILETKTLLQGALPDADVPGEPADAAACRSAPFPGSWASFSIGVLEMMEGCTTSRSSSSTRRGRRHDRERAVRVLPGDVQHAAGSDPLWPGELYPLNDPKNDVNFPTMGNQSQPSASTWSGAPAADGGEADQHRRAAAGPGSAGQVVGASHRAGMQTVLSQGDARPERVLRRFFIGLTQIWRIVPHAQPGVPAEEQAVPDLRLQGAGKDPYAWSTARTRFAGRLHVRLLGERPEHEQGSAAAALQDLMGVYVSQLAIQLGIIKPDGVYRLLRDYGRSKGQDPDKYLSPPTPNACCRRSCSRRRST